MSFAGSAIKQGQYVGRIDCWSQWKPTNAEPLWLLLSGATDPPRNIAISERRTRDAFLAGVSHDLLNMEDAVKHYLHDTVKDLRLTKAHALRKIRTFFYECKRNGSKPMLYYTGHGELGSGNWCFHDGTISIREILDMVPGRKFYPMIFSDACYSGHWANFCLQKGITGFHCLAACPFYSKAVDTKGEGGDLTLFMTGKKLRPSTEPVYSEGSLDDFPLDPEFDRHTYTDLITGFVENTQKILMAQNFHNGCFTGSFGSSALYNRNPTTCRILSDYDSFVQFVKKMWSKGFNVYSLACDERLGFGVFCVKDFGTDQYIFAGTSIIQKNEDFKITACAARGSTFYVVMTKDAKEYNGKAQSWFTSNTCDDVQTGDLHKCFVVMTKSTEEPSLQRPSQKYELFDTATDAFKWSKDRAEEDKTAISFYVPVEDKFIAVTTAKQGSKGTMMFTIWNSLLK